jgi:hypothetical protein
MHRWNDENHPTTAELGRPQVKQCGTTAYNFPEAAHSKCHSGKMSLYHNLLIPIAKFQKWNLAVDIAVTIM